MNNLLILGAGGHAKVVLECATMSKQFDDIALLDRTSEKNDLFGVPVIGEDRYSLEDLRNTFQYAFVAIGTNVLRLEKCGMLQRAGLELVRLIHPSSIVSPSAKIGPGSFIGAAATVNPSVRIGVGCIINTAAVVEHDCVISDGVHISPGAVLGGGVEVNRCTWLCLGAHVSDHIYIGENAIVAAGSVVIHDVPNNVLVAGVPAVIKKNL